MKLLDVILKHFYLTGLFTLTLLGALVVLRRLRCRNLDFFRQIER